MLRQQHILKRMHIMEELKNVFDYPLTVAVAAMGYGKTTSAKDFLRELKVRYAWVSVESNEISPQYIWDSLTRQLSKTAPEFGNQLRALGFPSDTPQRDKVIKIIEDYTYMTNTILVIDDYHFACSPEFDRLIEMIVRTDIEGFHILILTRTVSDINIDELMLKGYCYMIKSRLFEVSSDEIIRYFKLYDYEISDDTAAQVYEMSEGWVSAVYLIMQRYGEIGRLEPGKNIERLIDTAVMSRYSEREKAILKALCILDSFTPQQAVHVTGDEGADGIIEQLRYGNSFIRYDEKEEAYRIHNIFNSYLKKLLEQQYSEEELRVLYRRCGQWYMDNGDIVTGLKHLLKSRAYYLILSEFEKSSINLILDNNPKFILDLFEQIPIEVKYSHPKGYLAYIGFYVTNVDKEEGARLLAEIERYYQDDNLISEEAKRRINGEIMLIRAYIDFNDAVLMREKMIKAHEMTGGKSFVANKDKIITFGSPHSLYLYYREKGKFLPTMKCVEEMFPYYSEMAGGCGKGFDNLLNAEYCLETGNLAGAELFSCKAMYKAKNIQQVPIIICAQFTLARVKAAQGNFNEALEIMYDLGAEVEACNSPILSSAFDLCTGYMSGIAGKDSGFAKWISAGDMEQSDVLYQGMGFNYIIYGKYLLQKNDLIKLEVFCERMRQVFSPFNNLLGYLHAYILEAAAKYQLYGTEGAEPAIISALSIGRADNIVMPFAEYALHIMDLLKDIQRKNGKDEYIDRLEYYVKQYYTNLKNIEDKSLAAPTLTGRENDILRLIVEGKTNNEIASNLFIAEVTVRKNITCIYRKLGVTGRASAVRKTIELKII